MVKYSLVERRMVILYDTIEERYVAELICQDEF